MKLTALVMAGGKGTRMALSEEKPLLRIAGKTIIEHVIRALSEARGVDSIVVAVSHNTPRTKKHLSNFSVKIINTSGEDYVSDLAYAIKELNLRVVLTIGADLPLVTGEVVDKIIKEYSQRDKPSFVVAVPVKIKTDLGLGTEYAFKVDEEYVVPTGINVIDGQRIDEEELEQAVYVVDWKEVAVNINTPYEFEIAKALFNRTGNR